MKRGFQSTMNHRNIYLALIPAFLLLSVFQYIPFFSAFYRAFFDWNGAQRSEFIGWDNFTTLLADDPVFIRSLGTMGIIVAVNLVQGVGMALLLATLIHHVRSERLKYFYRIMVIIHAVVPSIVTTLLWKNFYSTDGLVNQLLSAVGLESYASTWLGDERTALGAILFLGFPWVNGVFTLIYLAAYLGINPEIYEAGRIDGVTAWKRFRYIEFSSLIPQTRLIAVLSIIGSIQNFEGILILTNGGPAYSTLVPGLMLYQYAFKYSQMGYASAIGVLMFIIILSLTLLNRKWGANE
jgi:raffinose/stachyose/melibiose transport system permease protein